MILPAVFVHVALLRVCLKGTVSQLARVKQRPIMHSQSLSPCHKRHKQTAARLCEPLGALEDDLLLGNSAEN